MIWKSKHIHPTILESAQYLQDSVVIPEDLNVSAGTVCCAIVGGGPKSFYALERLLAEGATMSQRKFEVHLYNINTFFASGQNYRPDQPDFLLINYAIGNINAWESTAQRQLVAHRLPLSAWIRQHKIGQQPEVSERDFASRELVGYYLMDCMRQTLQSCPAHIQVKLIQAEVEDIAETDNLFNVFEKGKMVPISYTSLLLVTGNSYENPKLNYPQLSSFPTAYPVTLLNRIPAQASVAVQGYGLTFIDIALQLTAGRGGKFEHINQEIKYIPSGNEPIIYPYSRSNLMMLPRIGMLGDEHYTLQFFTDSYIEERKQKKGERKFSFTEDILPVFRQEVKYAYYRVLWKDKGFDEPTLQQWIHATNNELSFSLDQLVFPSPVLSNMHQNMLDSLAYIENELKRPIADSPLLTAVHACRACLQQMTQIYNFTEMDGLSQKYFDEKWSGALNRLCFGPPLENFQKIHALLKAGYIRSEYAQMPEYRVQKDGLALVSDQFSKTFKFHIDGRIAKPNLQKNNNKLYIKLLDRGLIKELINDQYATGAIAIDRYGRPLGRENSMLYLYGTPTEGAVLDNDTLSRQSYNFGNIWAKQTAQHILKISKEIHEQQL